jgi:hypothetical protein
MTVEMVQGWVQTDADVDISIGKGARIGIGMKVIDEGVSLSATSILTFMSQSSLV